MSKPNNPPPALLPPPAVKSQPVKRTMYRQCELMHMLEVMHGILPIGPQEWDMVVEAHTAQYPGRDVESLRRKYTSLHRKKIPTGDPNIPPEVRLAKRVKHLIGDKAEVCDGTDEFNMIDAGDEVPDDLVDEEKDIIVPPPASVPVDLSPATKPPHVPVTPHKNMGLVAKSPPKIKEKIDFLEMMHLQMQADSQQRAHEMRMAADSRDQLNSMIGTIAGAYFGKKQSKKKVTKKPRKKKRRVIEIADSSSSSSMSSYHDMHLSSSDDSLTDNDYKPCVKHFRKRSAD